MKENDLVHGEFGKWLESIGINQRMAQQMIKVASNPELKTSTYSHLGVKALYEIATLPETERTKEHETSKGETKALLLILLYKENIIVTNNYIEKSDYVVNL